MKQLLVNPAAVRDGTPKQRRSHHLRRRERKQGEHLHLAPVGLTKNKTVTFVNKTNSRSYEAHTRKLGLDVIQELEFNNNRYYEMACLTKNKI